MEDESSSEPFRFGDCRCSIPERAQQKSLVEHYAVVHGVGRTDVDEPEPAGMRGYEPHVVIVDEVQDWPGMWDKSDFLGGDPDERSYAQRERDAKRNSE